MKPVEAVVRASQRTARGPLRAAFATEDPPIRWDQPDPCSAPGVKPVSAACPSGRRRRSLARGGAGTGPRRAAGSALGGLLGRPAAWGGPSRRSSRRRRQRSPAPLEPPRKAPAGAGPGALAALAGRALLLLGGGAGGLGRPLAAGLAEVLDLLGLQPRAAALARGSVPLTVLRGMSSSARTGARRWSRSPPARRMPRSSALLISSQRGMSSQSTNVTAMPVAPARPVRPMRCR